MALRARLAAADKAPAGSAIRGGWLKSVIESWREKVGGLAAPRFAMAGAFALAVAMAAFALRGVQPAPGELSFRVGVLAMAPADGVLRAGSLVATREDAGAVLELGERLKGERRIQLLLAENSEIAVLSAERVELRRGAVWASVVPNSGPFAIATPRGEVAVVGTQFGVEATDDGLALGVARGESPVERPERLSDGRQRGRAVGHRRRGRFSARDGGGGSHAARLGPGNSTRRPERSRSLLPFGPPDRRPSEVIDGISSALVASVGS
jgi:ferric-dicitrate binding protein FerR (iron transport regulator)